MGKTKKERKKEKQTKLKNKKLCKKYPFIVPRNVWSGKIPDDYDYSFTEYDAIMRGWRIGFGKFWLEDLRQACIETNYLDKLYFAQIKEKYGELNTYPNAAPRKVYDVIHKYEAISESVCCVCGSPRAGIVDCYGWFQSMCKDCWNKNNQRISKYGFKLKSYEDVMDSEDPKLSDTYYYNTTTGNGEWKKVGVDISETTNKIWNEYDKRIKEKEKRQKKYK
jgi:hypothetical protein